MIARSEIVSLFTMSTDCTITSPHQLLPLDYLKKFICCSTPT